MAKNADSALKLGQARGAAICAAVGRALAVHEYAPTAIKQAVVGGGRADKSQVQHMVGVLLGLRDALQADAADALAVAITHAHTRAGGASGCPRRPGGGGDDRPSAWHLDRQTSAVDRAGCPRRGL